MLLLEALIGPRMWLLAWLGLPALPTWLRVPVLIIFALALVRWVARLKLAQIGIVAWRDWSPTERSYFVQVFVLANVVLALLYFGKVRAIAVNADLWLGTPVAIVTSVLWGFYQELTYRGLLQTELMRRWGAWPGVLVANTLYTFGPLHVYHFGVGPAVSQAAVFAAIFAIGLYFSLLFMRSRNLSIAGVLHGVGDCYIVGLPGA